MKACWLIGWCLLLSKAAQAQGMGVGCLPYQHLRFRQDEVRVLAKQNGKFNRPTKGASRFFRGLKEYCYLPIITDSATQQGLYEVGSGGHQGSFYIVRSANELRVVRLHLRGYRLDKARTINAMQQDLNQARSLPSEQKAAIKSYLTSLIEGM